jgi:hypothetical protein
MKNWIKKGNVYNVYYITIRINEVPSVLYV